MEKYLSMIPKSIAVKRVKTAPTLEPIFKVPEFLPPKKKKKVEPEPEPEPEFLDEQSEVPDNPIDVFKEEPSEFHEEQPILIEFIDYQQSNKPVVPFTDINSLDKRSRILENNIDLLAKKTGRLVIQAEFKKRKLMRILKMLSVKVETTEEILKNIDVKLPISTVEGLNKLNKRLMDDRIFYQKFVRIFSFL